MIATIKATSELKSLINTVVGFVRINKSWVHHNSSYECAAWWEDSEIQPGVYPLILKENSFSSKELYLSSALDAIVVDDHFPALWGGVAISNKPYVAKNIGEKRTIHKRFELVESINKTGMSASDIDVCVNPMIWDAVINAARESLTNYINLCQSYVDTYHADGDGNFDSNISMIQYSGQNMAALSEAIMTMKRHQGYITRDSDYMRNLYAQNTAWVNAA